MYINSDLQTELTPSIAKIKNYLKLANDTDTRSRDTRPLMSFLQKLPQIDLTLLGIMGTRTLALLGFDSTIEMPEGVTPTSEDEKRIEQMKTRFVKSNIQALFNPIMNGIMFGLQATRLQWENTNYGTMVVKKKSYELTEMDVDLEDDDKIIFVDTNTAKQTFTRKPVDPETHIVMRFNPLEGIVSNYIGSYMRTNMIYILLKYWDVFAWARGNEKFGDPLIFAQYRKGASADEIDTIMTGLESMGNAGYAAFSDDVKLQLQEALKTGSLQARKELNQSLTEEITISILGQTLTTNIQNKGSFAAAKVHNYVREDILWGDLIKVTNVINSQYIIQDYLKNYGEPKTAYPIFKFKTDELPDFEGNARIISEMRSANIPLKKDEVYEKIGFTKPEPEDEVIGEAVPIPEPSVTPEPPKV